MKRCLMITSITFILLFIYYVSLQPDYVMDKDQVTSNSSGVNIRICTVYALMFSSAMGLLYLCVVMSVNKNDSNKNNSNHSNAVKVESPTFN